MNLTFITYLLVVICAALIGLGIFLINLKSQFMHLEQQGKKELQESIAKRIHEADESSRRAFQQLSGSLGQVATKSDQIITEFQTIKKIEDLLKPPKLRGGMGETLLEELLAQILPEACYKFQFPFRSGERVDAVIILGEGLVPVDAKFPLEQFIRLQAEEDEDAVRASRRAFIRGIKKHIDAIAQKYILPDEGTFDFALMYIPAENVYYETIIKDD